MNLACSSFLSIYPSSVKRYFLLLLLTFTACFVYSQKDCENDTIAPFFTYIAGDVIKECNLTPPVISAKAQDNCSELVTISQQIDTVFSGCPQNYTLFITHTATDEQGNTATAQQVVQIVDTNAPVFFSVPNDTTVFCSSIPEPNGVETWDNCGEVTIELDETFVDEPGCLSTLIREWTISDECGNQNTASQTITIIDDLAPEIIFMPEDQTVECDNIPELDLEATDSCSTELTIESSDEIEEGSCPNEFSITRYWSVSDDCGNEVSGSYVITVVDTQGPEFIDLISELSIDCPAEPTFEDPVVQDCGMDIEITFVDSTLDAECPALYSVMRTWTATDACGNSSSASQTIHVLDNEPPVFVDPPTSLIVQCEEEIPPVPEIEYFDECGEISEVIFKENPLTDFCGEGLRRTWGVFDQCGNMAIYTQDIEVNDTTPPMLVFGPADTTISCEDSLPDVQAIFEDNCSHPIDVSVEMDTIGNGCPDPFSISMTWTATDMCGNASTYTQLISVEDTIPPVISGDITDLVISCDSDTIPGIPDVTASDNCSIEVEITFADTVIPGACSSEETIVRTWTATDACGNSTTVTQLVEIVDEIPPVLSDFPEDITLECDNVPGPGSGNVSDCSDDINIILSQFGWDGSCEGTFFRQWTVEDGCGNSAVHLQEMTIVDTTLPTFNEDLPSNIEVQCDSIPAPAILTASDNCDTEVEIEFEEFGWDGSCEGTLFRQWTAIDDCANEVTYIQEITIFDNTPPQFSGELPMDFEVQCDSVPGAPELIAFDNCDAEVFVLFEEFGWDGSCEGTLFRQWTAIDSCANEVTHIQEITIFDNTPPAFLEPLPESMTVSCDSIPSASISDVTALDNCGNHIIVFEEDSEPEDCENGFAITRTWTATDECGNSASFVQILNAQNIQIPDDQISEDSNDIWVVSNPGITKIPITPTEPNDDEFINSQIKVSINPNPVIDDAVISVVSSETQWVLIEVFDINGIKVSDVYSGYLENDLNYQFEFHGEALAPGIYLYRITSPKEIITDKIILTK